MSDKKPRHGGWREAARGKVGRKPGVPRLRVGTLFLDADTLAWVQSQRSNSEADIQIVARLLAELAKPRHTP